jgi:SAM-dependent methyltransferase
MSAIQEVADRYARYCNADISKSISAHDDMFVVNLEGNLAHYMHVGRSAIDVIVSGLIAAGNPAIRRILDLPCGGGRVTRHLLALFPEAEIYVSDLDKRKEKFVLDAMNVKRADPNPNFSTPAERQYDLIFVGSLLTHLDAKRFQRATEWFIAALSPQGLLVLTTHGRRHNHMQETVMHYMAPERWRTARKDYEATGFGYAEYPDIPGYGVTASSPSWVMKLIENEPGTKVVGFHEAAWDYHQDVLVIQKHDLNK